ncbi:MAG: YdcF family protein [Lachnospiraceae bacterium]
MTWILGIGAVVCALYYVVLLFYSGASTSAIWIWLFFAAFLGALACCLDYSRRNAVKLPLWLPVSAGTLCVTGLLVFVIVEVLVFTGVTAAPPNSLDYVIVLGTKVNEKGISNSLKKRLDRAIEYTEQNPDTILVLSGGQGEDEPQTEARAMYEYLAYNGVPQKQMILEERSTSTVENMAYSKVAIDEDIHRKKTEAKKQYDRGPIAPGPYMAAQDKPVQIGVLTNDFHVYRAKQIGRKWGMDGIYGIAAESDLIMFPHLCVRECLAILKDKLMGNL